jgi:hypothetical protein
MRHTFGICALGAAALLATGCDESTGPQLSVDKVAGVYQLCSLTFTPTNTALPSVDVRAAAIESDPTDGLPRPNLKLDTDRSFEFEYVAKGRVRPSRPSGTYSLRADGVTVNFGGSSAEVSSVLLLPSRLSLELVESPKALVASGTGATYSVARGDYARLAGVQEAGLAGQIPGSASARFATSCR